MPSLSRGGLSTVDVVAAVKSNVAATTTSWDKPQGMKGKRTGSELDPIGRSMKMVAMD